MSKAVPFMSGDNVNDETEDCEPLLADDDSMECLSEGQRTEMRSGLSRDLCRFVRQSNSDNALHERTRVEEAGPSPSSSSVPLFNSGTRLRPAGYRSVSTSQIESCSRAKGLVSLETSRQQELVARLSSIQQSHTLKRSKLRNEIGSSSPNSRTNSGTSTKPPDAGRPFKTCLKQKARSANATPHNEPATAPGSSIENSKLRRVKTVEFEKAISDSASHQRRSSSSGTRHGRTTPGSILKGGKYCPGIASLARRSPACPAVTRTDVHVVAMAPSLSTSVGSFPTGLTTKVEEADGATPTIQIVESGNGRYEVIWDDVPMDHSTLARRRSSSASQALEAAGTRDLERVNTKLTEWSGTWKTPSGSFKPSLVVFPDDDGRRPRFECAIEDDEGVEIFAPPNSGRASAIHSRRTSRPTSARMSRAASQDGVTAADSAQKTPDVPGSYTEWALDVPDPEAWSAHLAASRRKLGLGKSERRLSDLQEVDLTFRNHRDSLTLAHSRLVRCGALSPELFAHRDSVTLARKRMHVKNQQHKSRVDIKSEPGQ